MSRITTVAASPRKHRVAASAVVAAALVLSCGDGTEPRRAVALAIATQPSANAQIGIALSPPVVVEIRDQQGARLPRAGVSIIVTIADGGGTLAGTTTQPTDAGGRATFADLAIAGTVGARTLRFSADGLTDALSTTITFTAGSAATVEPASPVAIQGTVATAVSTLPAVLVKDASGNVVPGISVAFAVSTAGGALAGAMQTTNSSGIATLGGWTLPTVAGQHTVTATTPAVAGSGITFTATATPDVPSTLEREGFDQAALYGAMLPRPLVLRVLDRFGNPNASVAVTWEAVSGGGTVETRDGSTNADGFARASYRLGVTPGTNLVRASIGAHNLSADYPVTGRGFSDQISVSAEHSCALDDAGFAYCWGWNSRGSLGDGTTAHRARPTPVAGGLRFRRISTGLGTTCALTMDDVAYCWGTGAYASLGDGTTTDRLVPTPVVGGDRFTHLGTGGRVTCGLTRIGAAYCWGNNDFSQLGAGTTPLETCYTSHLGTQGFKCTRIPLPVVGGHIFTDIGVGSDHSCGSTSTQELYCWGYAPGWGGTGPNEQQAAPVRAAPGFSFSRVFLGAGYTCGIVAPHSAYCWGAGHNGTLGIGIAPSSPNTGLQINTPTPVAGNLAVRYMGTGIFGTCAIVTDGRLFCWGWNGFGSVGDGTTATRYAPVAVSTKEIFNSVSPSGHVTCGRIPNGQLYCWGKNTQGQLGNGGGPNQLTPVLVTP